ncbi:MAG TPA: gephyrin-like molybdotransferase Glp [Solirubrobacterales bacterium]|nr:gephyrin-like molybdotransferase Glp [Solirubrobacterales bacterium]
MASELIEIEWARAAVLDRAAPLAAELLPLRTALGRVLAEEIFSEEPVPSFDNSAMDGFAVRAEETRGARPGAPATLRIAAESRAGRPARSPLGGGEAIAISTGAMIPAGADAVVRIEETRAEDGRILLEAEVEAGCDIRRAGEDIRVGTAVLGRGTRIGPAELGVLASVGCATVSCHRRPRVHVIASGDELLEPGETMRSGGVRNSNAYTLSALAEWAGAEVCGVERVADDREATRAAIASAVGADAVLISGGVSVGEHDHVKGALAELEVAERFWGVALKPGRPTWFGTHGATLVFGLPGNPVSAMVTFLLLARPALVAMSGAAPRRLRTTAKLASDYEKPAGRTHAVRCRMELGSDGWSIEPTGAQGSHILTSMLGADCLALIPAEAEVLPAGTRVEVELIGRG